MRDIYSVLLTATNESSPWEQANAPPCFELNVCYKRCSCDSCADSGIRSRAQPLMNSSSLLLTIKQLSQTRGRMQQAAGHTSRGHRAAGREPRKGCDRPQIKKRLQIPSPADKLVIPPTAGKRRFCPAPAFIKGVRIPQVYIYITEESPYKPYIVIYIYHDLK